MSYCLMIGHVGGLELQVVTVATEETDGFRRFAKSAKHFNINVEVRERNKDVV